VQKKIDSSPVVLFSLPDVGCGLAAEQFFEYDKLCYDYEILADVHDPKLEYLRCVHSLMGSLTFDFALYANNTYNSFLFVGGIYIGDGYKTDSFGNDGFDAAGANRDCSKSCDTIISTDEVKELIYKLATNRVAVFGVRAYPSTSTVIARFDRQGVCYSQNIWEGREHMVFKYLQCLYGDIAQSFVFLKGDYFGTGSSFSTMRISDEALLNQLTHIGATMNCSDRAKMNVQSGDLKPCSRANDLSSNRLEAQYRHEPTPNSMHSLCDWEDLTDHSSRFVCVEMSQEFLTSSTANNAIDFHSAVVPSRAHGCLTVWEFAAVAERDPVFLEGLTLDCSATNHLLHDVLTAHVECGFPLANPQQNCSYGASAALIALERLCGRDTIDYESVTVSNTVTRFSVDASKGTLAVDVAILDVATERLKVEKSRAKTEQHDAVTQEEGERGLVGVAVFAGILATAVAFVVAARRTLRANRGSIPPVHPVGTETVPNPASAADIGWL
jgi:hypothetical protein